MVARRIRRVVRHDASYPHGPERVHRVEVISEGAGLVQRRGGEPEAIRAGDTVQAGAGEWHWHGAGPGTFMTHLAVQEADENGQTSEWGEHVTDDEYRA